MNQALKEALAKNKAKRKEQEKEEKQKKKYETENGKTLTGEPANKIIINPEIDKVGAAGDNVEEAAGQTIVLSFGRMNPPTIGHEKLVQAIRQVASKVHGEPMLFLSHSQDKSKNPIPYDTKLAFAKRAFGSIVRPTPPSAPNLFAILKMLDGKADNIVVVVGSDRVPEFKKKLSAYNGRDYHFKSLQVVSAGERDPDGDEASAMSASKLRKLAKDGDESQFKRGLPRQLRAISDKVYKAVRLEEGVLTEETEIEEALTTHQRIHRAMLMRRLAARIALGRKKALKRHASHKTLKKRARRLAIKAIRKKILRGQKYADLPYNMRSMVDARVLKRKKAIEKIATRIFPKLAKAESTRRLGGAFKGMDATERGQVDPKANVTVQKEHVVTEENIYNVVDNILEETLMEYEYELSENETSVISKKADDANVPADILETVYRRGVAAWELAETNLNHQQYAFNRVNSFLAGGKAYELDEDLVERELAVLDEIVEGKVEDQKKGYLKKWVDTVKQTADQPDPSKPEEMNKTKAKPGRPDKQTVIKKILEAYRSTL